MATKNPRKKKMNKVSTTVGDAVSTFFSEVETLGSEMRDWADNMPEAKQSSSKYDEVSEAADALENVSEPDVPEVCSDVMVEFEVSAAKVYQSRSVRLYGAIQYGREAIEVVQTMIDDNPKDDGKSGVGYSAEQVQEMTTLIDEINEMIDSVEGIEFPGMYG